MAWASISWEIDSYNSQKLRIFLLLSILHIIIHYIEEVIEIAENFLIGYQWEKKSSTIICLETVSERKL